ncbi:MAG: ThiF family adenylyltransferase [Lachnospiraceae bacterium]|nr:ThiF family adenylyltransferase [Lachnospiraceae bacterium]
MTAERYARQLAIVGEDGQILLAQKRVLIVGCGGLGGYLLENMLRIGVGHIIAVDPDRFEASNLNRQLLCTESLLDTWKTDAAADRALDVNSAVDLIAVTEAFSEENGDALVEGCDLVLDALDSVPARLLLEEVCGRHDVPLVHGAIRGEIVQAAVVPPRSGMLRALYAGESEEIPAPESIAYTPACCAAIQSAQALRLLLGQEPSLWGRILQLNLETLTEDIVSFL